MRSPQSATDRQRGKECERRGNDLFAARPVRINGAPNCVGGERKENGDGGGNTRHAPPMSIWKAPLARSPIITTAISVSNDQTVMAKPVRSSSRLGVESLREAPSDISSILGTRESKG